MSVIFSKFLPWFSYKGVSIAINKSHASDLLVQITPPKKCTKVKEMKNIEFIMTREEEFLSRWLDFYIGDCDSAMEEV